MPPRLVVALTMGLVAAVGVAVVGALPTLRRPLDAGARRWWTATAVLGTFFGVALAMRAHNGGFLNVLMPLHYGIALGLGLVTTDLRRVPQGAALTGLVFLVQLGWLGSRLDVDEVIPTDVDVHAGQEVLSRLSRCADGPIFAPYAAWLPRQVGRDPSTHLIALWDLKEGPYEPALAGVTAAAHARRWSCVVTGGRQRLGYGVEESYRPETTFRYDGKELTTKTGWRVRPYQVWVPKPRSPL
jgi:hypothetical protein